ncbi:MULTISPECIES: hypothetical protein [Stenotrophomonas]|uniref:hypothetical protein n=1 Tax=Stenotrophomonas sp. CFBP8994 TaxID=3096527 RepID=UPI002A699DC8|nr:hypothetical protein [Stenotrophomonas sp. CFBP8994]MDY0981777.1 hypothetical protein [Stenotrophomonas sp. CFBP8994]
MLIKVMAWLLVLAAAFFAMVGAAPFGGGAFFPVVSLPAASFMAWRGQVVAPLLVVCWAVIGFWISVLPMEQIFDGWGIVGWLAVWTAVLFVGVVRGRPVDHDQRS